MLIALNGKTTAAMSSVEISELTGKRHDQVLRTARDLVQQGVTHSVETPYRHPQNGVQYPQHVLNKRDSLVLVARLSPEFTGRVVDRWMELEATVPAPTLPDFTNPAAAARAWADEVEARQALQLELTAAAPAVEFVEKYVDCTGLKGFRQVAKMLRANERVFRAFLADAKIMYSLGGEWMPYAAHLTAGRFQVKTGQSETSGHTFNSAKFTAKGVDWVAGEFAKYQLKDRT
jgi:phage antirepressor YoqD-like protein